MIHAADDILLMAAALHVSGISPSERLVLIAYADHADKRGYCWPSVDRLAEITGLSRATVTRANKRLRTLGLIVSIRRVNPRTGEPISNLTRLNIARMRAMRRRPAEPYADLIQEITLPEDGTDDSADGDTDDATETGSDQLIHHGEPYLRLTVSHTPSHHEPLTSQRTPQKNSSSYSSSPLTDARQSQPSHRQEEEEAVKATPDPDPDHDGGDDERAEADERSETAAAELVSSLPATLTRGNRRRLLALVVAALAAGWTTDQLRAELTRDLGTASSRVGVWITRLRDLGDPPPTSSAPTVALPPRCGHPDHDPHSTDRLLYPDDGPARPCPTCHPMYLGDAR